MLHKLVFIAGLPRSGTTMVQNILDSHPEIYGGPEFDRIPNFVDLRRKLRWSVQAGRIDQYTSNEEIDSVLRLAIQQLLIPHTEKHFAYISEKTPWNILVFSDLMEMFPEARFVHVLRNPLDVWRSMTRVAERAESKGVQPPDFTMDVGLALNYMLTVYDLVSKLEVSHATRFLNLRFEDFLLDTETQCKALCNFLQISWNENMLDFHNQHHPGEETMTKDGIWYTKEGFKKAPSFTGENKRVVPDSEDEWLIAEVLKSNLLLNKNGYDLSFEIDKGLRKKIESKLLHYRQNKQRVPMPARFLP
jgi:hypothetical protein